MEDSRNRHHIASLAHAKAHEVQALRAVEASIGPDTTAAEVRATLRRMIRERKRDVAMIGSEVAGHA